MFQVKDLCKIFNVKLAKEEMERLFRVCNTDKDDKNSKDKGQVGQGQGGQEQQGQWTGRTRTRRTRTARTRDR